MKLIWIYDILSTLRDRFFLVEFLRKWIVGSFFCIKSPFNFIQSWRDSTTRIRNDRLFFYTLPPPSISIDLPKKLIALRALIVIIWNSEHVA